MVEADRKTEEEKQTYRKLQSFGEERKRTPEK